jgi:hypothetical protein
MRLAILGATGRIGGHLLSWTVDAGHPVHVLARDAGGVPVRPGITVTEGSALDPVAVADVVAEADAVLSALGPRGAKAPALLATAASNVVAAMAKTGAHRLLGRFGAGPRTTPKAHWCRSDDPNGALVPLRLRRARLAAGVARLRGKPAGSGLGVRDSGIDFGTARGEFGGVLLLVHPLRDLLVVAHH